MATFSEVLDALRRDDAGWSIAIPRTWANGRTVFGGLQDGQVACTTVAIFD